MTWMLIIGGLHSFSIRTKKYFFNCSLVSLWFTHTKYQPVFSIPFLIWQWPFDKCYPSWQSTCSVAEWAPTSWRWRIQSLSVQSIWCNWNPGTENYKKKLQWELQQINSNKYRSILRHYQEIWKNEKNIRTIFQDSSITKWTHS